MLQTNTQHTFIHNTPILSKCPLTHTHNTNVHCSMQPLPLPNKRVDEVANQCTKHLWCFPWTNNLEALRVFPVVHVQPYWLTLLVKDKNILLSTHYKLNRQRAKVLSLARQLNLCNNWGYKKSEKKRCDVDLYSDENGMQDARNGKRNSAWIF